MSGEIRSYTLKNVIILISSILIALAISFYFSQKVYAADPLPAASAEADAADADTAGEEGFGDAAGETPSAAPAQTEVNENADIGDGTDGTTVTTDDSEPVPGSEAVSTDGSEPLPGSETGSADGTAGGAGTENAEIADGTAGDAGTENADGTDGTAGTGNADGTDGEAGTENADGTDGTADTGFAEIADGTVGATKPSGTENTAGSGTADGEDRIGGSRIWLQMASVGERNPGDQRKSDGCAGE